MDVAEENDPLCRLRDELTWIVSEYGNNSNDVEDRDDEAFRKVGAAFDTCVETFFFAPGTVLEVQDGGKTTRLTIVEVEFYFNHAGRPFNDVFTHGDDLQKTCAHFYLHRSSGKKAAKYRNGSFKGMDVTFGNGDTFYGGVLVRAVRDVDSDEIIEGPCNVVQELMKRCGIESRNEIDAFGAILAKDLNVFTNDRVRISLPKTEKGGVARGAFVKGPRVGLTLKQDNNDREMRVRFLARPYRYVKKEQLKRVKKCVSTIACALHARDGFSANELVSVTGKSRKVVDGYLGDFEKGKGKQNVYFFVGRSATTVADQCQRAGTLHSFL